jgi:hypothetical protein
MQEQPQTPAELEYRGTAFLLRDLWATTATDLTRFVWMIRTPAFLLLSLISFLKRWSISESLEELNGVDVCLGTLILAQHYVGKILPNRVAVRLDSNELHRALYVIFAAALVVARYNSENNDLLNEVCSQDRLQQFVFLKNRQAEDHFQLPASAIASCRGLRFGDAREPIQGDVNREFIQATIAAATQLHSFTGYGNAAMNVALPALAEQQSESLEVLEIGGTSLDTESLKKIAKLKNLRTLYLRATSLEAATLAEILAACEKLEVLVLDRVKLQGELTLTKNANLKHLQLYLTKLESAAITELLSKTALNILSIDDENYALTEHASVNLTKIVQLDLASSKYNDQALQLLLQKCPNLRELELFSTTVTDNGMKLLKESKQLQRAVIYNNSGEHRLK